MRQHRNGTGRTGSAVIIFGLLIGAAGCDLQRDSVSDAQAKQRALELLLPELVKIQPFTRVAMDESASLPTELVVYLRAEDRFGDPVKVGGTFNFELYAFKQASGDHKGRRIELWQTRILDHRDQLRYWDQTAQMYEFRLQIGQLNEQDEPILKSGKVVLVVTYNTPWGEHLEDEYVLSAREQKARLRARSGP